MKKALSAILIVTAVFFLTRQILRNNLLSKSKTQSNKKSKPQIIPQTNPDTFKSPIDKTKERTNKKTFGIFVTPQNSPVQPERFRGFHTGVDFEIFPKELDIDIPIKAVCTGKLVLKRFASGYGGVAVQDCKLKNDPITAIYGHLKLSSINIEIGADIKAGEIIGILGKAYSPETDGERKHLHLGFHKGNEINLKGYVDSSPSLSEWIDPCLYVCFQ